MTFDVAGAKKAGYSDEEIENFLEKNNPNFDREGAKKAGYSAQEIDNFLAQPKSQSSSNPLQSINRALAQIPQGLVEATTGGIGANIFKILGMGEGLAELDELEERLPELKKKFPHLNWPEKIDREKYLKSLEEATNAVPTVSNIAGAIEEKTGLPLAPKTNLDKAIRFVTSMGGFKAGTLTEKMMAGLKSQATKDALELAGVPEPIAEGLAIYHGLHTKTPGPHKVPSTAEATLTSGEPPGGGPSPSEPPGDAVATAEARKPKIAPRERLPQATSQLEMKEQAIEALKPAERKLPEGKPLGIEHKITPIEKEVAPLTHRVKREEELGRVVSKEAFKSEAEAGREISGDIKKIAAEERKPVEEAYKKAKQTTEGHVDTYAPLAHKNDKVIEELEAIEKRNAGEEAVYQQARAIRNLVGQPDAYIEQNASRLIAQSDSMAQLAKYELPYTGYKGRIKKMVRDINEAVISSLQAAGKDAASVVHADKLYGRWADRFLGDEIEPYLNKKILDPEQLARRLTKDEAVYRAVKKALGERNSSLFNKIDRELLHNRIDKYYKNPSLVNSKEYTKDLSNLQQLIGKEKTANVDAFLRKKQLAAEHHALPRQKIREGPIPSKSSLNLKEKVEERIPKSPQDFKSVEDIDKAFRSRSGIRKLKKQLKDAGKEELFTQLAEQKIIELFREGKYGAKKLKGKDIVEVIDKHHEVLNELMGEDTVDTLYKTGVEHLDNEVKLDMLKNLGKYLGKMLIPIGILRKIITGIPI